MIVDYACGRWDEEKAVGGSEYGVNQIVRQRRSNNYLIDGDPQITEK